MRTYVAVCVLALAAGLVQAQTTQPVQVRQEKIALPWHTCVQGFERDPRVHNNPAIVPGSGVRVGTRELDAVIVENEYLRLTILPEMGGAVARVIYKPSGEDMFFWEGAVKDQTPYWESGVKANFPAIHHLVSTNDQAASWRLVRHADGSVTVAMWMEFSRFSERYNGDYWGRYTNMMLSQMVTLAPARNDFQVTWRILNPAPYMQGAKVWNDALWPRNHTPQGVVQGDANPPPTDTEWIFPTHFASHHGAKDFRVYEPNQGLVGKVTVHDTSVFGWRLPYGFAGLWYPSVKVNRLRLHDPNESHGAKQYFRGEGSFEPGDLVNTHIYNFIELFGSLDTLMEGVENWLPPGQTRQYSHRYTMTRGIGKADYANEQAVFHIDPSASVLEVVTLSPVAQLSASLDGKGLGAAQPCAPDKPARFALPAGTAIGRVKLAAGDKTIVDISLPLALGDDTTGHDWIRQCSDRDNVDSLERYGDQFGYCNALQRLSGGKDKTPSLALGRMQYRAGLLAEAIKTLKAVTDADANSGQAWHLLACALLEPSPTGAPLEAQQKQAAAAFAKALSAAQPYAPARYFVALMSLGGGDAAAARQELAALLKDCPAHWEGRLLKTWLDAQDAATRPAALAALAAMDADDPADPRVQFARMFAAQPAGDAALAATAREAYTQLAKEAGASRRLREFNAATRGVYYPPQRMQQ